MQNLFVYGTLRKGGSANGKMRGANYLGKRETVKGFALGKLHGLPGMYKTSASCAVIGDLYYVTNEHLNKLDGWEDSAYERKLISLADGGKAWAYLLPMSDSEATREDWR